MMLTTDGMLWRLWGPLALSRVGKMVTIYREQYGQEIQSRIAGKVKNSRNSGDHNSLAVGDKLIATLNMLAPGRAAQRHLQSCSEVLCN